MQKRIFSLLFLIAGVLLSQSVQAQTLVDTFPVEANGTSLEIVPNTYTVSGSAVSDVGGSCLSSLHTIRELSRLMG